MMAAHKYPDGLIILHEKELKKEKEIIVLISSK